MVDIVTFDAKEYTWQDINGQRCLVPYTKPDPFAKLKVGSFIKNYSYTNMVVCINDMYALVEVLKDGVKSINSGVTVLHGYKNLEDLKKYIISSGMTLVD